MNVEGKTTNVMRGENIPWLGNMIKLAIPHNQMGCWPYPRVHVRRLCLKKQTLLYLVSLIGRARWNRVLKNVTEKASNRHFEPLQENVFDLNADGCVAWSCWKGAESWTWVFTEPVKEWIVAHLHEAKEENQTRPDIAKNISLQSPKVLGILCPCKRHQTVVDLVELA